MTFTFTALAKLPPPTAVKQGAAVSSWSQHRRGSFLSHTWCSIFFLLSFLLSVEVG